MACPNIFTQKAAYLIPPLLISFNYLGMTKVPVRLLIWRRGVSISLEHNSNINKILKYNIKWKIKLKPFHYKNKSCPSIKDSSWDRGMLESTYPFQDKSCKLHFKRWRKYKIILILNMLIFRYTNFSSFFRQ